MPPIGEDIEDSDSMQNRPINSRRPKVLGKPPPPTKMSEDGTTDWGERCIDLYEIIDKVFTLQFGDKKDRNERLLSNLGW